MNIETKRYIEELAYCMYKLFTDEPWLSAKDVRKEISDYYNCKLSDLNAAYKIAVRWDKYGIN